MKPHPRIRKTIKWLGLFLSVVLLAAWVMSRFCVIVYATQGGAMLELHAGRVVATMPDEGPTLAMFPPGWHATRKTGRLWSPLFGMEALPLIGRRTFVALWPVVLGTMALTVGAWLPDLRGRRDSSRCPRCGYDRSGLAVAAVCPECGAGAPRQTAAR